MGAPRLGLAALAEGDAEAAVGMLAPIWDICLTGAVGAPGPLWWQGDLVEALWRTGRSDDLRRLIEQLEADAERTGSSWAAAVAARGWGLLKRDVAALRRSAVVLDRLEASFEAARSRLLIGEVGDPGAHVGDLAQARDALQRLGARPWSERAAACIGSQPVQGATPINALTRAELRVALLVGRGRTNREVADELFVSPRTIDSHLQRIYRKLDLRSRTELALLITDKMASSRPIDGSGETQRDPRREPVDEIDGRGRNRTPGPHTV